MISQLTDAVRERLTPAHIVADLEQFYPTVIATMPREVYVCGPGVQQLVSLDDDGDRPAILVGLAGWPVVNDPLRPIDDTELATLPVQTQRCVVELDVLEVVPRPRRYDRSGRWKAAPPSRRRHLESWRRAPDSENCATPRCIARGIPTG